MQDLQLKTLRAVLWMGQALAAAGVVEIGESSQASTVEFTSYTYSFYFARRQLNVLGPFALAVIGSVLIPGYGAISRIGPSYYKQ